jgi:UDP-N-acetylglucosamine/UDP-N-acetylgalactosamine 4-epimerase
MIEEKLIQSIQGFEKKEPVYQDFRTGDVRHSQANMEKSKLLLGYLPTHNISQGLDIAFKYYIKDLNV